MVPAKCPRTRPAVRHTATQRLAKGPCYKLTEVTTADQATFERSACPRPPQGQAGRQAKRGNGQQGGFQTIPDHDQHPGVVAPMHSRIRAGRLQGSHDMTAPFMLD